jgi:hypothetical protein
MYSLNVIRTTSALVIVFLILRTVLERDQRFTNIYLNPELKSSCMSFPGHFEVQTSNIVRLSLRCSGQMHHCLEVEEILRQIFEEVSNDKDDPRGSIVALAVTCQLFSAVALDIIWYTMSSLAPLVMCLPEHLWTRKSVVGEVKLVRIAIFLMRYVLPVNVLIVPYRNPRK